MPLLTVTEPAAEPVSRTEAKTHLREVSSDNDTYIDTLITVARRSIEILTQRALVTQTLKQVHDCFPAGPVLSLEFPPLQSVTHVKYYDEDDTLTTLDSALYIVDTASSPGRILLRSGESWPDTRDEGLAVEVTFVAGYGLAAAVPAELKHAILLLVHHWYENREVVSSFAVNELPKAVEYLALPYRVWS